MAVRSFMTLGPADLVFENSATVNTLAYFAAESVTMRKKVL